MLVGVGASRVRDMFQNAKKEARDKLDALAGALLKRETLEKQEIDQLLNTE